MVTAKAKLYQIYPFGKGLLFQTESVANALEDLDAAPGSTAFFKPVHAVRFRCTLSLPDGSKVVSDLFARKKDAEQNASQQALDQLSVRLDPSLEVLSLDEKWENLQLRIAESFSDKNILSYRPLREHFKAAVNRKGDRHGQVPMSALVSLDSKINTLCKAVDRKTESNPAYAVALLCEAASKCPQVKLDRETLCISRVESLRAEIKHELMSKEDTEGEVQTGDLKFLAVRIPSSTQNEVIASDIVVKSDDYYLDVLAREMGLEHAGRLLLSRPIGKTYPSTRLFWPVPKHLPQVQGTSDSDLGNLQGEDCNGVNDEDLRRYCSSKRQGGGANGFSSTKNVRASLLMGYPVYGDAILAAVGGDWKYTTGKVYSLNVSRSSFYRMLLGRFPQGSYKLSRGAVLTSKLPHTYSTGKQWRGMSPRGLLIEFCQHHRLREPAFTLAYMGTSSTEPSVIPTDVAKGTELLDDTSNRRDDDGNNTAEGCDLKSDEENTASSTQGGPFTCKVRVEWQKGSAVDYESDGPYRNRSDATQSAALKALHQCSPWFENCLSGAFEPVIPASTNLEKDSDQLTLDTDEVAAPGTGVDCCETSDREFFEMDSLVDSSQVDKVPPAGSMVTIRYTVRFFRDAECPAGSSSILLEKKNEFGFELGSGSALGALDSLAAKMAVGNIACFVATMSPPGLLYATLDNLADEDGPLTPGLGSLKYTIQLLKYVEAPEERMEAAHFKPSLSKQRVEFALSVMEKMQAKSLIDLGCGSGSLLDSLLDHPTQLRELVGVDISHKGLIRAAKLLSQKLKGHTKQGKLEKIDLYEGSISVFYPPFQNADVAVCIEVVEHMDPEPLEKFPITVLGMLKPRVLIVSTPNFEYNPILQGLDWDPQTNSVRRPLQGSEKIIDNEACSQGCTVSEGSVGKRIRLSNQAGDNGSNDASSGHHAVDNSDKETSTVRRAKFRNEDHRFEWTRAEFRLWASKIADEFDYDVQYDGVGGSGEDEGPGYASQIALFTRKTNQLALPAVPPQLQIDSSGIPHPDEDEPTHVQLWHWECAKPNLIPSDIESAPDPFPKPNDLSHALN